MQVLNIHTLLKSIRERKHGNYVRNRKKKSSDR